LHSTINSAHSNLIDKEKEEEIKDKLIKIQIINSTKKKLICKDY